MRKARVQWHREARAWGVEASSKSDYALYWATTWAEAMFLAQLLADPHEYVRAVGEVAWEEGWSAGWEESCDYAQLGRLGCAPNPYRKDRNNDKHDA